MSLAAKCWNKHVGRLVKGEAAKARSFITELENAAGTEDEKRAAIVEGAQTYIAALNAEIDSLAGSLGVTPQPPKVSKPDVAPGESAPQPTEEPSHGQGQETPEVLNQAVAGEQPATAIDGLIKALIETKGFAHNKDAVERAIERAKLLRERDATPADLSYLKRLQRILDQARDKKSAAAIGDIIAEVKTEPNPATAGQTRKTKPAETLLQAIKARGGIRIELAQELTGEPPFRANRRFPGLFTRNGKDLDILAHDLAVEDGFDIHINLQSENDTGGVRQLEELIGRMLAGETIYNERGMEHAQEAEYRAGILDQAREKGILTRGRSFDAIEAELMQAVEDEKSRLEDEQLLDDYNAVRDELESLIGAERLDQLIRKLDERIGQLHGDDYTRQAIILLRSARDAIKARIQSRNAGETRPDVAGEPGADPGPGRDGNRPEEVEGAPRPDFTLQGQTEADLAEQERQRQAAEARQQEEERKAAEAERKAREDAEIAARQNVGGEFFSLDAQVNDKTAQKKADAKRAEDQLAGQGDIFGQAPAPSAERFEAGRALTKEQRKTVLDSLVDVYRKNKAPKEFKGVDQNGNERYGYAYSPEFFVKSDITGAMVRYYVTLPDGRIAHPTELFPDYTQSDIDAEMQRRKTEEQNRKAADEFRLKTLNSRKAGSMNEANRLFWSQNRHSIDAQNPEYIPALLTNGTEFIRTDPANVKRDLELLGEGWQEKAVGAAADSKPNIQEHKIGDALTIMGRDVILAKQKTINGVRYELFNDAKLKDSGGATRVVDVDSGNVVSLKTYDDYAQAEATYEEATPKNGREEQTIAKGATVFSSAGNRGTVDRIVDGDIAMVKWDGASNSTAYPVDQLSTMPRKDRDSFTLQRLNRDTQEMESHTFTRGQWVKVLISGSGESAHWASGEITGISHADREFKVGELDVWHPMGAAYEEERPAAAKPKEAPIPLSQAIETANKKNGDGLTDADLVDPIARHDAFEKRLRDGQVSVEEFKNAYAELTANESAIIASLSAMTKDEILASQGRSFAYRWKNDKKADVVRAAFHYMQGTFIIGRTLSYGFGANMRKAQSDAIQALVDSTTEEDLKKFADGIAESRQESIARAERIAEAAKDPKTLDDFRTYLRIKMADGMSGEEARRSLTPEQRATFDDLLAEESRGQRNDRTEQERTRVQAAAVTTSGQVIETKHTKTGEPLFVVNAAERVEREVYNHWNATAKRLGGWYSSYRGGGAVPGFQFKTRENADAFLKFLGGDVGEAREAVQAKRDAFQDDRSQSAAERLTEMADALAERADKSLGRERKANTERRARMAASAENSARADKALAQTMRNIAMAIEAGTAKLLDRVRQKTQVEMLRELVGRARDAELRAKFPSYADQEKHRYIPASKETADYAEFPKFEFFRSDLASLGRRLLEIDGAKKLGQRLLTVADDVTDAYLAFAKENLHKVSTFSRGDGQRAVFSSKDDAEAAIARSGFKGKAIVLPFKRGQNVIILSPSAAQEKGLWAGDPDKRITLTRDFGMELAQKHKELGKQSPVPWYFGVVAERLGRLKGIGIETPAELRAALREFVTLQQTAAPPDKIKELERKMVGRRQDGLDFFPTPADTAQRLVEVAGVEEGMAVLEPSAGMGHIADAIREAGAEPDVVEMAADRRELLEAKGYRLVGSDFMDMSPVVTFDEFKKTAEVVKRASGGFNVRAAGTDGQFHAQIHATTEGEALRSAYENRGELEANRYDRIIMNPPFSNRRDAEHVRHAYELLRPGGRLVAIMSEGTFFGQDRKAQEFRDWLDSVDGTSEKLDEGTFMDASLPVNTGVNARMVVIDKPANAMLSRSGLNDYNKANGILEDTAGHRTIDGTELAALRREAAGLERPETGKFLYVTEDGRAIATGEPRTRIPESFARFAEKHDLKFEARRRIAGDTRHTYAGNSEPLPIEYRESGAMYFGEIGQFVDRTGKSRFSRSDSAANFALERLGDALINHEAQVVIGEEIPTASVPNIRFARLFNAEGEHEGNAAVIFRDGRIPMLVDIKMFQERGGRGEKYVRAMTASAGESGLMLYDIQKKAEGFWTKMGAIPENLGGELAHGNGFLFWPDYSRARLVSETDAAGPAQDSAQGIDDAQGTADLLGRREAPLERGHDGRIHAEDLSAVAAEFRQVFPGLPIQTADSEAQLPKQLRQAIKDLGAQGDTAAAFHDGAVWMVRSGIHSLRHARRIVPHEATHAGLDWLLGPAKDRLLLDLNRQNAAVAEKAKEIATRYRYSMVRATEEALADMGPKVKALKGWNKLVAWVRRQFRKLGWVQEWTDRDVEDLVLQALAQAKKGPRAPFGVSRASAYARSNADSPLWFSPLAKAVDAAKLAAMPPAQWKAWLLSNGPKLGVKKDEIQWSGILDWLDVQSGNADGFVRDLIKDGAMLSPSQRKKIAANPGIASNRISKADIAAFLEQGGVKVEEVVLGKMDFPDADPYQIVPEDDGFNITAGGTRLFPEAMDRSEAEARLDEIRRDDEASLEDTSKFSDYQLPGGKNYRELLLTLPERSTAEPDRAAYESWARKNGFDPNATMAEERYRRETGNDAPPPRTMTEMNSDRAQNFRSSHFDQPNILAHIRFNDRTDAQGRRVLFIEEIQSDWAQKGRKEGFSDLTEPEKARKESLDAKPMREWSSEDVDWYNTRVNDAKTPSAPFVGDTKAWTALALKRMIRYAAENGYDAIAWTTGEQQADRYDLSKKISKIELIDNSSGGVGLPNMDGEFERGILRAFGLDGRVVIEDTPVRGKSELADLIGKEAADNLLASRPFASRSFGLGVRMRELSGLDLKVGGEGMRGYYDGIVPQVAGDLLKKFGGGKVVEVRIGGEEYPDIHHDVFADGTERVEYNGVEREFDNSKDADAYVAELKGAKPQPGFLITDALRAKAMEGMPLFSRTSQAIDLAADVLDTITQPSAKSFGMLKGLQTQLHKARTVPAYGRAFRLAMAFRNDLSRAAFRPWESAKDILPAYDDLKGAWQAILHGKKSSADITAAGRFLFDGTMYGGGNPLAGVVYSDAKLKSLGATDEQIRLYRQAREAIDASLDEVTAAVAWKLAKPYLHPAAKYIAINDPSQARDTFLDMLETARQAAEDEVGYPDQKTAQAAERELRKTIEAVTDTFDHAEALKAAGYAPLMRFGRYTMDVVEVDPLTGKEDRLEFRKFETEMEAKFADKEARKAHAGNQNVIVTRGVQSENSLFQGVDPETVALFAKQIAKIPGLDINKAVLDEYYRSAVSERSALVRTIKRKGIAGYSEDLPRVLASFLTSNARYASSTWHMGDLREEIQNLRDQKVHGDIADEAQALYDYINGTQEPGAWMRGLMFAWYLGGSPAAAAINLTQPVLMTFPYLAQFGPARAAKAMAEATVPAVRNSSVPAGMRAALRRAQEEGVVEAQEIHHLYQEGMRPIISKLPGGDSLRARAQGAAAIWGALFGMAENFNRRITFIAAYKMASADPHLRKRFGSAYEFARRAVEETQGIYAKENRPDWARGTGPLGAVGVAAFTFKQYSIQYVELVARMWKSGPEGKMAAGLMLGLLMLASGLKGLPFADDLKDLVDTILQRLGYRGNAEKAIRDEIKTLAGERMADLVLYGLSAETPVDVQGRLGLGNMLPATGLFKPSEINKASQVAELFGPPGGMARQIGDFSDAIEAGKDADAFKAFSPKMVQDVTKAWQMWETGEYRDSRNRKVAEVSKGDAAIKAVGFQPQAVAEKTRRDRLVQQDVTRVRGVESNIVGLWVEGIIDKDVSKVAKAREMMRDWNQKNPETKIRVTPEQVQQRVKQAKMDREQRMLKSAPKEMRGYVAEGAR